MNADFIAQFSYHIMHHISKLFTDSSGNVFKYNWPGENRSCRFEFRLRHACPSYHTSLHSCLKRKVRGYILVRNENKMQVNNSKASHENY